LMLLPTSAWKLTCVCSNPTTSLELATQFNLNKYSDKGTFQLLHED
jgi:hypothetical protein